MLDTCDAERAESLHRTQIPLLSSWKGLHLTVKTTTIQITLCKAKALTS